MELNIITHGEKFFNPPLELTVFAGGKGVLVKGGNWHRMSELVRSLLRFLSCHNVNIV